MAFNVEEIKSSLVYGGARPSLFHALVDFGSSGLSTLGIHGQLKFPFLCQAASLPGSTVSKIEVPYFGRKINVSGNRTFEDWTVTILNDEDFAIRQMFELWMGAINSHVPNLRQLGASSRPISYKGNGEVWQYAKDTDTLPVKRYRFVGLFPTAISEIEVNWDTVDAIENFTVTLAYDYWVDDNTAISGAATQYDDGGALSGSLSGILGNIFSVL